MYLGFRENGAAWKSTGEKRAAARERVHVLRGRGVWARVCGVWQGSCGEDQGRWVSLY